MRRCLIAVLGVIGCLAATQALAERRVALVVGNAQYAHTPALPNPRNDAQDIADALRRVGFEVTLGYDLNQTKFARIIDDFARALDGADVGLFFYAGHGLQINEKNYLVSTEAKLESTFLVPSETIELDAVIRLMESKANTNLIFLDACRNNPLTDNLKRNLAAVNRAVSVSRGLARIEPTGRDTLIAFSSAPGQEAADGRGRNSPFTASLLRHMPKPGLEVSVMLKEVTADVRQETNNVQRPQQLSDMSKAFYFVKAEPAVVTAPAPSAVTQHTGAATNVAAAAPTTVPQPAAPVVSPVVAPDVVNVGRKLQKELLRVGCAASGIENDSTWGATSREALRSFNERTRSIAIVDQPTPEALKAVRSHKERVCPVSCGPGTELRGTSCVAKPPERSRHAARPSEREQLPRVQSHVDAAPKLSTRVENQMPDLKKGETWFYMGGKQCKNLGGSWGKGTNIICP
jgi:uncharacterized caspase-like protein